MTPCVSDIENLELCKIPAPPEIKKGGIVCFTRSFFFLGGGWGAVSVWAMVSVVASFLNIEEYQKR